MEAEIRRGNFDDGLELAACLRQVELDELAAATGRDPLPVILEGIESSDECYSLVIDGEVACMWGIIQRDNSVLGGRRGTGWLLTTDLVEKHAKTFWQVCLHVVPDLLSRWDEITNAIDLRHKQALRWAKRLGFRLGEPIALGDTGFAFCPFSYSRESIACAHQQ